jgi:hypothetical protein
MVIRGRTEQRYKEDVKGKCAQKENKIKENSTK